MTRRKREIVGLTNERDFPHVVELALPPGGFRSVFLEIDTFHRERRIPVRRGRSRTIPYSILFPRRRHCGCIPQSLRWRALDPRGYVVGCAGREARRGRGLGQKGAKMTTMRTHFAFRVDTWTPDGESIVEHAGIEDYQVARATYRAACERWPATPITLRQGARVIEDSRRLRLA
jgi:hypothetical protein